jgi:hypothetical protein
MRLTGSIRASTLGCRSRERHRHSHGGELRQSSSVTTRFSRRCATFRATTGSCSSARTSAAAPKILCSTRLRPLAFATASRFAKTYPTRNCRSLWREPKPASFFPGAKAPASLSSNPCSPTRPSAVYEDAEMGSRVFVNEHTGRLLKHDNLAAQLKDFVESSAQYEPRKWVMENGVDCVASSRTLKRGFETGTRFRAAGNGPRTSPRCAGAPIRSTTTRRMPSGCAPATKTSKSHCCCGMMGIGHCCYAAAFLSRYVLKRCSQMWRTERLFGS